MHFCFQLTLRDGITTARKLGILFNSAVVAFLIGDDNGGGQEVGRKKRSTPSGDGHKVGRFKRSAPTGLFTAMHVTDGDFFPPSMVNDLAVIHVIHDARLVALQWTAVGDDLDNRDSGPGIFVTFVVVVAVLLIFLSPRAFNCKCKFTHVF